MIFIIERLTETTLQKMIGICYSLSILTGEAQHQAQVLENFFSEHNKTNCSFSYVLRNRKLCIVMIQLDIILFVPYVLFVCISFSFGWIWTNMSLFQKKEHIWDDLYFCISSLKQSVFIVINISWFEKLKICGTEFV